MRWTNSSLLECFLSIGVMVDRLKTGFPPLWNMSSWALPEQPWSISDKIRWISDRFRQMSPKSSVNVDVAVFDDIAIFDLYADIDSQGMKRRESSCLMGSVFQPTLKNGRNLWSVPWAALRTKCTEAPLPQGLTAHKISGICLRNLLGQVFHPHPPEAVSILVHQLPNHNANNCQRLHLSDWSATCFDTWPQSWQTWQLQSLLGYCDVSCINSGGIKMYLGWPVRSICGKVNLFLTYAGPTCRDSTSRKNDI